MTWVSALSASRAAAAAGCSLPSGVNSGSTIPGSTRVSLKSRLKYLWPCRSKNTDALTLPVDAVDRLLVHRQGSFVNGLRERRMGMNGALDILGAGRIFHGKHGLADQFARHRPDHVNAEHLVIVLGGYDLRKALRSFHRPCASARCERESAHLVGPAAGLDLFLGLSDPGDFRGGIDHRGNDLVIHLAEEARDQIGHHHALFLALVREHGAAHHVADRPDIGHAGAAMFIDLDEAPLIEFDPRTLR